MSNFDEDEDSSDDVAEDSFKGRQDRSDDDGVDGLESSVDRKIEETKIQSEWSSVGCSGDGEDDDVDEVERLMLERSLAHSRKQVKPHIDNECDDSEEFAHDELEQKQRAVTSDDELDEVSSDGSELKDDGLAASIDINTRQRGVADDELDEVSSDGSELNDDGLSASSDLNMNPDAVEQTEQVDAEQDASQDASSEQGEDEQDPLEESSFDNAMMAALEGKETHAASGIHDVPECAMHSDEAEAEKSDSDGYVVQDAVAENSFDDSMMSEGEDESIDSRDSQQVDVGAEGNEVGRPIVEHDSQLEHSFGGDDPSDSELAGRDDGERDSQLEHSLGGDDRSDSESSTAGRTLGGYDGVLDESTASSVENVDQLNDDDALDESTSSLNAFADQTNENSVLGESAASMDNYQLENDDALEESSPSVEGAELLEDSAPEGSAASLEHSAVDDQLGEDEALEESAASVEKCVTAGKHHEDSELEESSSVDNAVGADQHEEDKTLEESTTSLEKDVDGDRDIEENALEESASSMENDTVDDQLGDNVSHEQLASNEERGALANEFDEDSALEESASSIDVELYKTHALEESSSSITSEALKELPDNYKTLHVEEEPPSNAARRTLAQQLFEDKIMLEESASSLENDDAELNVHDDGNAFEGSSSSVENVAIAAQLHQSDALEESAVSLDHHDELDASLSSAASGAEVYQPDENDALEVLASRLASDANAQQAISRDRVASRYASSDPLTSQHEDNDIHDRNERNAVAVSHSDPLAESSFDEEVVSDHEDEASGGSERTAQTTKYLHSDEEEDEWSEEQLRAAERSVDRAIPESADEEDGDSIEEAAAAPAMSLHMEEDEDSSEEEETMVVQSQPTFTSSLSRLGMGTRRLNLEEDDDMDEGERLLVEQSASTTKAQRQPQLQQFTRPLATGDDEFGELSLQSHGDDGDEFGEASIRSREDNEFGEASLESREDDFGEASIQSNDDKTKRFTRASTPSNAHEDDEFCEVSIRSISRDDDEFDEASIKSRSFEDDESGARLKSKLDKAPGTTGLHKVGMSGVASILSRLQDDEFGESSFESQNANEFSNISTQSRVREENDEFAQESQEEDEFGEALIRSRGGTDEAIHSFSGHQHKFEVAATPLRSVKNDEFGEASVRTRTTTALGEARIQSRSDEEDDITEASMRSRSLEQEDDDEFGEISIPLHEDTAQVQSRSLGATYTSGFTDRAVAYHEGLMSSPAKLTTNANPTATTTALHEDSASEAENDYMDESFDLDESLEEDDEDNERHV